MRAIIQAARRAVPLLLLAVLPPAARAQLISLKTVPVATGDQFLVFPSERMGMGSVSIAVDDPHLDPFVNPARGSRVRGGPLFGAPTFYAVSDRGGAGRTLPGGALLSSDRWFGGGLLAFQQVEQARREGGPVFFGGNLRSRDRLGERSAYNRYAFGMLGRRLPGSGVSVAASVFGADLEGMDGVALLYPLSERIGQDGHMLDYRLGLLAEASDGRTLDLLLLHNRFNMTHEVTYLDWGWDPALRQQLVRRRLETNLDRTRTWGAHLRYQHPLGESGWRAGGIVTGNHKSHPKIPNYEIVNIPRDPGNSWAYNFGVGASRTDGPATFAVELVYEPAWSDTWGEADAPIALPGGRTIPAGGKTVENDFRFSNFLFRAGVGRQDERLGVQAGLQLRSIHYWLEQQDHVIDRYREQEESWLEWTPTWGVSFLFPEFRVGYTGRATTGTGRPGIAWDGAVADASLRASDVIVAPGGPLALDESVVWMHQVSVSVPLRGPGAR